MMMNNGQQNGFQGGVMGAPGMGMPPQGMNMGMGFQQQGQPQQQGMMMNHATEANRQQMLVGTPAPYPNQPQQQQPGMMQNQQQQQFGANMMNNAMGMANGMMAMGMQQGMQQQQPGMMMGGMQQQQPGMMMGGMGGMQQPGMGMGMGMMPPAAPQIKCGPDQSWKDFELVQFRSKPLCATYSGTNDQMQIDKTNEVQALFNRGQMQVQGGIHTAIGDPKPGVAKIFRVWYQPSESYRDMETVTFKANQPHQLVKATYGPEGSNNDYTQQVRQLIQRGQLTVNGGIHTAIGDPAPGVPKKFNVFYAGGLGIDPAKQARLQQQFMNWDADRSGFLDRSEALAAFFTLFPGLSPTQLQQKITESDTNGDGQLSFDEFARIAAPYCQ